MRFRNGIGIHGIGNVRCVCALTTVLSATAVLVAPAVPARALEQAPAPSLVDQKSQLQRDVRALERGIRGQDVELAQVAGTPATNAAMARLDVRIGSLEDDVRTLTGRVEQLGYDMRQLGERVDKVISDFDFRLRRLEEQAGVASERPVTEPAVTEPSLRQAAPLLGGRVPGADEPSAAPAVGARAGGGPEAGPGVLATVPRAELDAEAAGLRRALPPPDSEQQAPKQQALQQPAPGQQSLPQSGGLLEGPPQEQYAQAFGLLRASRYDEAEQALKAFLLQNPDHALSDNARYWLGETYYVRGQYPEAAQQFVDAYQKNPSGTKSADALLKLGMALSQLGKTEEACATFRELTRTQPDAPETVRDKAAKEAQRSGCS